MSKVLLSVAICFLVGSLNAASLYKSYPFLVDKIPCLPLAEPTPLEKSSLLYDDLSQGLMIKRDNLCRLKNAAGKAYFGGNKIRKLQFLMADALQKRAEAVITFGAAGSNHAVETAGCCNYLGLSCYLVLRDQVPTPLTEGRLLLGALYGARQVYRSSDKTVSDMVEQVVRDYAIEKEPYVIPVGGSNPLGMLGYVDAAFELVEQCAALKEDMPDSIYVPCGSHGTAAGLAYGLALAGAHTKVEAIAVDEEVSDETMAKVLADLKHFMVGIDDSFNKFDVQDIKVSVRREFCGDGYAVPLESTGCIQNIFLQHQIVLDGTYTAKAAAAMVQDALDEKLRDKKVLFWLTLDSDIYTVENEEVLKKAIPAEFQKYIRCESAH